ncbi:hypothetical protein CAC42_4801 [Sphaceloma murrayae]|uniref:Transmembrane protein n=1 Tax=Sphaceloma murrayae TaxID=2082308 RepID=A0A2K1QP05_9PEZI|nr:hypothetical protein CAC42_4801 [Sphaceloma murrayae]
MDVFLSPTFKQQEVTRGDMNIASIAWGFTLGFGFLTVWTAIKQTLAAKRRHGAKRLNSPYIWMIWLEIIVCLAFSIECWLHLAGVIPPGFAFYFTILTFWALQVQFLLQIIINRVMILMVNKRRGRQLRIGVALLITLINISVYCIWIPARLQISKHYIKLNEIWDRCEKGIYLIVDALLNLMFIRIVQQNLVSNGLKKYKRLVRFNMYIIGFSLSMDVLIIAMMSLNNTFVYMQFHPLAYIVKLNIEMSMADLIGKVAKTKEGGPPGSSSYITGSRPHISMPNRKPNSSVDIGTVEMSDMKSDPRSETFVTANTPSSRLRNIPDQEHFGRDRMEIYMTNEYNIAYGSTHHANSSDGNTVKSMEDAMLHEKEEDTRPLHNTKAHAI